MNPQLFDHKKNYAKFCLIGHVIAQNMWIWKDGYLHDIQQVSFHLENIRLFRAANEGPIVDLQSFQQIEKSSEQ
jgi:hypothetical protein